MIRITWILAGLTAFALFSSCNNVRRSPGRAYMPDMAYSRAYETYASTEGLRNKGVHYTAMPVSGTVARGDMTWSYPYANDSAGYVNSRSVTNPVPPLDSATRQETERLYLINCAICHGVKLDGNGPLWKGGDGPYPAAPRNLITDPVVTGMADGTMFHSLTYGKNTMGSYASQLSTEQRWQIVHYINEKQVAAAGAPAPADSTKAKK